MWGEGARRGRGGRNEPESFFFVAEGKKGSTLEDSQNRKLRSIYTSFPRQRGEGRERNKWEGGSQASRGIGSEGRLFPPWQREVSWGGQQSGKETAPNKNSWQQRRRPGARARARPAQRVDEEQQHTRTHTHTHRQADTGGAFFQL